MTVDWIDPKVIEAALKRAVVEGELPYMARIGDFTDEQVQVGALKEADEEAESKNRAWMEAIIDDADKARGLRVVKEGRTTYKDNKFTGRWRLVTDWVEVRDA
jgi:predicted nuclease with TOPRIM domain